MDGVRRKQFRLVRGIRTAVSRAGTASAVIHEGRRSPEWRSNSSELLYLTLDGMIVAVPIKLIADPPSLDIGPPVPLFAAKAGMVAAPVIQFNFTASADAQRFLVNRLVRDPRGAHL